MSQQIGLTHRVNIAVLTRRKALSLRVVKVAEICGGEAQVFGGVEEALAASEGGPLCVVCDAGENGEMALEVIDSLRRSGRRVPLLVIAKPSAEHAWLGAVGEPVAGVVGEPLDESTLEMQLRAVMELAEKWRGQDEIVADYRGRLASLTARERQILLLIVAGKLNKQIAAELGIAARTVEIHRGRVLKKLVAGNIAGAARILIFARPEWIDAPGSAGLCRVSEAERMTAVAG